MKKTMFLAPGLIVLVAVVTIFMLCPSLAFATRTSGCYFNGKVTLDGDAVPAGSLVTGKVSNCSLTWQTAVTFTGKDSYFLLIIPEQSGAAIKDGGQNGDIATFTLTVNGMEIADPIPAVWTRSSDVRHPISILTPTMAITTSTLDDGMVNLNYSQTLTVAGGQAPYAWTSNNLPADFSIDANGVLSGTPTVASNSMIKVFCQDSGNPQQIVSKDLPLIVYPALLIKTEKLDKAAVETWPALPLLPGWVKGVSSYTSTLTAEGGNGPYTFSANASELAACGLTMNNNGVISGTPTPQGEFPITFTVTDSANPPKSASKVLSLKVYLKGDANGSGQVNIVDVTYVERVILGLNAPTAGCDASLNGTINVADVTKIERIILGLDSPDA